MKSLFKSISKQLCVTAELFELSFQDMVDKSDGDRRNSLRGLVACIEARILCALETGETNRRNLTSSVTRYGQKTG